MSRIISLKSFGLSILAVALFFAVPPSATAQTSDETADSASARAVDASGQTVEVGATEASSRGQIARRVKPDLTSNPAPSTAVGSTSATQTTTITFTATTVVSSVSVLTQGSTGLDFAKVGGTCGIGVYVPGLNGSCTVTWNFTPKYPGQRLGAIELLNNTTVVATAYINGIGLGAQGEFPGGTLTTVSSALDLPRGVSVDAAGNVYVADSGSGNVYKYMNGTGTPVTLATGLAYDVATTVDGAGNVYVSVQNASASAGGIYEIVGGASATTTQTATRVAAINYPDDALVTDGAGNVYFASSPTIANAPNNLSQINSMAAGTHTLTTLVAAGSAIPGLTNATLGRLIGEAIDQNGNLYFPDFVYNRIYKLASGSTSLTTLVNNDGNLNGPHAIAVDNAGNLYVTNYDGNPYLLRYGYDGGSSLVESTFETAISSVGIVIDASGNFYLLTGSTAANSALYKFTRNSTDTLTYPSTQVGSDSAAQSVMFENDGNASLTIYSEGLTNAALSSTGTTCASPIASGVQCTFSVEFAPTTVGTDVTGSVSVNDNTLGAASPGTAQLINISGPSTAIPTSLFSVAGNPSSVTYGSGTGVQYFAFVQGITGEPAPTGTVVLSGPTLTGGPYTETISSSNCSSNATGPYCGVDTPPGIGIGTTTPGSYTITAVYSGNSIYATSTGTGTEVVNGLPVTLSAITTTPSSVNYGTSTAVTLSETVSYSGSSVPAGPLKFTLNGVTYTATCTGTSSPLTCTATVPAATVAAIPAGSYTVTSTETASGNYASGTGSGTFTVNKLTPTFGTMSFNPTTVVYGANTAVTITDTLAYTGPTPPTGAVTFTTFGVPYTATCTGSSSPLTCTATVPAATVAQSAANTYSVTPTYTADTDYNATTGTAGTFVISAQTPTLSTITASPSSVAYGSSTAVTLSETVAYTGSTVPSGTMTYTLNGVQYTATCTGSSSPLTCTASVPASAVAALPYGTDSITSSYTAAGYYGAATGSGSISVTAGTPGFGTVTFSPSNTEPYGTSQAITISVPLTYTGSTPPTGTVTFAGDGNTWTATCTGNSSPLTCTATIPASTVHTANVGVYPITPSITAAGSYGPQTGTSSNFTITKGNLTFGGTTTLSPTGSETYDTNQAVTFTDSLSYLGVLAPTGQVTVSIGGTSYVATCTGSSSPLSCSYTLPAATVAALNAGSYAIQWSDTTDANYLAATLAQTNSFVIAQATGALSLVAATPGSTTTGVTSTVLTATMGPAVAGVTVTFTDATTGAVLGTGVTNAQGVATLTVNTSTTGVAAGLNNITASFSGTTNYTAAASTSSSVYVQGILVSSDLYHNFSTNPGTYDGSPVCNGSNGTAGSTCTQSFGVVVTNFTPTTQVINESFTNSASGAFSSATNCPAAGLPSGKTCNIVFYYNPPYGDGCTLNSTTCTQGTFEEATWSVSASGQITGIGNSTFSRSGATSFPADLVGKALLASGNSLAMTPLNLTFGPQAPGTVPTTQNIFVTNTESQSQNVSYTLPGAPFTVVNNCGATLAAGATCEIQVSYTSSTPGTSTSHVVATPQVGNVITATVTGTTSANTGLSLTTTSHNFGSITDGTSTQFGLGVTNNGTTAATLTFTNTGTAGYSFYTSCPNPLPAGATCQADVTFAPTTAGAASYGLTVHSNVAILPNGSGSSGAYTDLVSFTGTGVVGGTLTATSTGHNFGTVKTGSEATAYGVELSNNTAVALTLTLGGGTFASNGAADGYTMQTNCPATLAVNANCEIVFSYTPAAVGTTSVAFPVSAKNGSTSYPMSSGGSTYTSITLTGTGD